MLGILLLATIIVAAIIVSPWFLIAALALIVLNAWANSGTGF